MTEGSETPGQPAIGNVLGFSLLLRDRRALLTLQRRMVGPGVRIGDYEAEVTGIALPLSGPLSAHRFRHHRCRARRARLSVEHDALQAWLAARWRKHRVAAIELESLTLELESSPARARVVVEGHTAAGGFAWIAIAVGVDSHGRHIHLRPQSLWIMGEVAATPAQVWEAFVRATQPAGHSAGIASDGGLTIDPLYLAVARPFVASGWKAPDPSALTIAGFSLSRRGIELELASPEDAPGTGTDAAPEADPETAPSESGGRSGPAKPGESAAHDTEGDAVGIQLQHVRAQLEAGDFAAALAELRSLSETLDDPAAAIAATRWRVALAGPRDRAACLAGARQWVTLDPGAARARRTLVARLALAGEWAALGHVVTGSCRLPHPPRQQVRLELALALLLAERLNDPAGALALLDPLADRLRDDDTQADLLAATLQAQARAHATATPRRPALALQALDEALSHHAAPAHRAAVVAAVAERFATQRAPMQALTLLLRACREDPEDDEWLERAIEAAVAADDREAAIALLETRVARADSKTAGMFHRRLVELLLQQDHPDARTQALDHLRTALTVEPQAVDLLRQAAQLEQRHGSPKAAIDHLRRLVALERQPGMRVPLQVDLARLLAAEGRREEAWGVLAPALEDATPEEWEQLTDLAVQLAPDEHRDRVVERILATGATSGGRALLDRALLEPSAPRRLRDLRTAAELLDDPRPALRAVADMVGPDDAEPWLALADACRRHDDPDGESHARREAAARLLDGRNFDAAIEILREHCRRFPEDREGALALAIALGRAGAPDEGCIMLEALLAPGAEPPGSVTWRQRLGLEPEDGALELMTAKLHLERRAPQVATAWLRRARDAGRNGGTVEIEAASRLVDVLAGLGQREDALEAASFVADRCEGRDRADWLVRAAGFAGPSAAVGLLREALDIGVDGPAVLDAYERALRLTGDLDRLEDVFRRRLDAALEPAARADILERWIDFIREQGVEHRRELLAELLGQLLKLRPDNIDLMTELATTHEDSNQRDAAARQWQRLFDMLPPDDPRGFTPALRTAACALAQARPGDARTAILRAVALQPDDPGALQRMGEIAAAVGDAKLARQAAQGLLEHATSDQERALRQLELARSDRQLGRSDEALTRLRSAAGLVEARSPLHVEIAEMWLETATLPDRKGEHRHDDDEESRRRERLQRETTARAELRHARGATLPALERRNEARVLIELGRFADARQVLEEGLRARPSHELLLSSLKEVALAEEDLLPYLDALARAVSDLTPGELRDRLATELAFSAMQEEDAGRVLAAIDHIGADRARAPELLDLRDWAVRSLGREDAELEELQTKLITSPRDRGLLSRLRRLIADDGVCVERLLGLADNVGDDAALPLSEAALDCACEARDGKLVLRALECTARHGASTDLSQKWPLCQALVAASGDERSLAGLIAVATTLEQGGAAEFGNRARDLLLDALAEYPGSVPLHQALWERTGKQFTAMPERIEATRAFLREVVKRHELPAVAGATLVVGLSGQLDRRHAAEVLARDAAAHIENREAFVVLLTALEEGNHWPEVLRLLELRVGQTTDLEDEIDTYKRLAHVCGDVLHDPDRALHWLELARERAPRDPDVLLALLERYYARTDLDHAIELTATVLAHVPMGDKAFAALAHRAVDAAFARNDMELAGTLLRRVLARIPSDERTRERLQELAAMAGDPEARVRLLASVAQRQGGSARIEALEERARLLVEPLERLDEAIEDLRAVTTQAPERTESRELLLALYERCERWTDLVDALEAEFPRLRGPARSRTLGKIATIQREHLQDMARAEQSLRLALENLGTPPADVDLAEQLRGELLDCLQHQGRYVDLAIYLERELAPELEHRVGDDAIHPARLELLNRLARLYRDDLDDDTKAARVLERLEQLGELPDDGLATLARWYRSRQRHADLVRILRLRAEALSDDPERRSAVDQRIAELLEGPLGRPHEAAHYWLDAYLVDPAVNTLAGARARVLLSGTDAVANVRQHMRKRLELVSPAAKPALLTLLADILAPQEDYEREAETTYREAITLDPTFASAHEGLGRMLAREGRLSLAVEPLCTAARSPSTEPTRAAEDAAIAARALFELGRPDEAEAILKEVLIRVPDAQRALLELARLYHRSGRPEAEAGVLDELSTLPLSSMLKAEVAYRRAMLLEPGFAEDALSPAGERARAYLLESVSSDGNHVAARQALLELARRRNEWSIVAHMHYLAIRELSPGPQRALVHVELAETYLQRLGDIDSALRNIESAIQQAPNDVMVVQGISQVVHGMPEPGRAAERFEHIAGGDNELDDASRARLWLLAADLRMQEDDVSGAEAASQRVLGLHQAPEEATSAAARRLDSLMSDDSRDLKRQKSGLLRLLDSEEQALERIHILDRLREIGQVLGDADLVERVARQELELARRLPDTAEEQKSALVALRDVLAARGEYRDIVTLYEGVAEDTADPDRAVDLLVDAARFAWQGLHNVEVTVPILHRALALRPGQEDAESLLAEVAKTADPSALQDYLHDELASVAPERRTTGLALQLAEMARRLGRHEEAVVVLRELLDRDLPPAVEMQTLGALDAALERIGESDERIAVLERAHRLAVALDSERSSDLACDLASVHVTLGNLDQAAELCRRALHRSPGHAGLLRLHVDLLQRREDWPSLAETLAELAEASLDEDDRERWLTRAARIHLDHPEIDSDPHRASMTAWNLLQRAREEAPRALEARILLLGLAYQRQRWDETIELAQEIRTRADDSVPELILGAFAEAFVRNRKGLARSIGNRHDEATRQDILWPAIKHILGEVAVHGPLPRLDAVLAAGADLLGGGYPLLREMKAYAAGQPLHAGLTLALGRLYEASGDAPMARYLYQLAAFMEPGGPIPPFVTRLPEPELPEDPLGAPGWSSLAERGALRTVLIELRPYLVGIRTPTGRSGEPSTPVERDLLEHAQRIVAPWRDALSLSIPLAFTPEATPDPIQVRNTSEPGIVVGHAALGLGDAELRFRLAAAVGSIAMGLAILRDAHPANLDELLDALGQLVNPAHEPRSPSAQVIADALASRGVRADRLTAEIRRALAEELVHWTVEPGALAMLDVVIARSEILFATRLSGRLDGALMALARDQGLSVHGHEMDPAQVLGSDLAHWLLRTVGLH